MKRLSILAVALATISALTISSLAMPGLTAYAQGGPPEVVCVPATALNPAVPHDTWSGLEITLKGTAHDPDGDATLATYEWDFGDGSPPISGAVADPYAIEVRHTYVGSVGDLFVATLTVTDNTGDNGTDQYLVQIKDGTRLAVHVNVAIDEGLWRLHKEQVRDTFEDGAPYGYWPYWRNEWEYYPVSATGASTEAFEIHGSLPTGDPGEDPYVETVQRGLNYLLSQLYAFDVNQDPTYCPMGDPDVNGNGYGLASCCHTIYESGISLMALASSRCPYCIAATGGPAVAERSYLDITQDMVDGFAYCQADPIGGIWEGGWRYGCNEEDSDNSVSQWPVIGMESAEVNFGPAGLLVPQFVKDELNLWIDYIQNDVDGEWPDGGSGYMDPCCPNVARTGGLLCEMKFVGDTTASTRAQAAVDYISRNWDEDGEHFPANSYYAFYSVMKGFRLLGIQTIDPINDPSGFDWYGDPDRGYAQYLVGLQQADGTWPEGQWSHHPLASAWAILTLKKTVVQPGPVADAGPDVPSHPPIIEVTFDGTGSYHRDPGRSIVQYIWDFGDGSPPVEGPVVPHAFPAVYNPDGTINWDATVRDYTVTLTVVDDSSPPLSDSDTAVVHITPPPWPPVADADGPYAVYPCDPLTLDGSGSYDPNGALYPDPSHPWHGEIVNWEWDLDNDGEYDDATGETVAWSSCDQGVHVVGLKVTNSFGQSDEVDTLIYASETVNRVPVAESNGPYLGAAGAPIDFDGTGSFDPDGDELTYNWDFGDGNTGTGAAPTHIYAEAGINDVCLTVNDSYVDSTQDCTIAVVYDPSAGFVTGGGWIDSPEGAYTPDPSLTGKATFGFVSKYKKGAEAPTGNTEFQFHAGDLNFHSSSYQWLVVAGHKAMYKGDGTINGSGNYGFMLSAIDEALTPSTDVDMFRIKIWDKDAGDSVVYDNQLGDAEDADPTTQIAGGSIVIHTGKK